MVAFGIQYHNSFRSVLQCGNKYYYHYNVAFCTLITLDIPQDNKIKLFLAEIEMMKKASKGDNPHVINMVGCITRKLPLTLILEYAPCGSLLQCLRATRSLSEVS